jgi:hypothetical protein
MNVFELRHSWPLRAAYPPDFGTMLVDQPAPPLQPFPRARVSIRLRPLPAPAAPADAGLAGHSCRGDDDADPWGFRGPILGR